MNRLYVIKYGTLEIKGLVSPGELPEVVRDFYLLAEQKGAKADYKGEGLFVAVKEEVQVTLTIGAYHQSMPSKMLVDALMEVMGKAF
ncbi:MAG: hypothetical protein ILP13_08050 [Lachnospiraceae bacterium]|nr:hypothetical protein [Lachnospiraceae bacterium]